MSRPSAIRGRRSLLVFAALAASTCLSPSGSVAAEPRGSSASGRANFEQVNYEDLNLGRKADQTELKWRIHRAAMHVCEFDRYLDLACYDAASADGMNQARRAVEAHLSALATAAILTISRPTAD